MRKTWVFDLLFIHIFKLSFAYIIFYKILIIVFLTRIYKKIIYKLFISRPTYNMRECINDLKIFESNNKYQINDEY